MQRVRPATVDFEDVRDAATDQGRVVHADPGENDAVRPVPQAIETSRSESPRPAWVRPRVIIARRVGPGYVAVGGFGEIGRVQVRQDAVVAALVIEQQPGDNRPIESITTKPK